MSNFSEVPYVVGVACCSFVTAYAFYTPGRELPMVTNAFGAVCHGCYCAVFLANAKDPRDYARIRRRAVGALAAAVAVIIFGVLAAGVVFPGLPVWLHNVSQAQASKECRGRRNS